MAKTKIKISLNSSKSIQDAIKQLENYKKDLIEKTKLFCELLADIGIETAIEKAEGDSHKFSEMVTFEKEYRGGKLYLIGRNSNLGMLHTEWYDGQGQHHTETISPILALEWGTAGQAIKGHKCDGAVTGNHVNDNMWYYYTNPQKTETHIATSEEAHQPMLEARNEMAKQIQEIAKKVWG